MKLEYSGSHRGLVLWSLALVVFGNGCVRFSQKLPARTPLALPPALAAQVSYSKLSPHVLHNRLLEISATFRVMEFTIQSFVPAYGTNKELVLECYIPNSATNADTIINLPVSAGATYPLERGFFGPHFARRGYVVVLVHRENLKGIDENDPHIMNTLLAQSVLDGRQVIDWIETRAECNPRHIGILGVSMGAIKGADLVAVDNRIRAAVLVLGGADVADMLTYSKEGAWQKRKKHSFEHDRGISGRRAAYMQKNGVTRKQFEQRIRASGLIWDPKDIGQFAYPSKVLLVNGFCDTVIPFRDALKLRHAYGDPQMLVVLSGHYTSLFYLHHIEHVADEFFKQHFTE